MPKTKERRKKSTDYEAGLIESLRRNPEEIPVYLNACMEEGIEVFFLGLQHVAKASGGMAEVSKTTGLGRESLYKSLAENGNPEFKTIDMVIEAMGCRFAVEPRAGKKKASKKRVTAKR